MKKLIGIIACVAAVAAMAVSCETALDETPEEGKFAASLVGEYSLKNGKISFETSTDSLRVEGVALYGYAAIKNAIDTIALELPASESFVLSLKADGTFGFTLTQYSSYYEEYYTTVYPDDAIKEAEEDGSYFPFVASDFTYFSTASKLYLAINRPKLDAAMTDDSETVKALVAPIKRAATRVSDVPVPDDIVKYAAALIYISKNVYALPSKYALTGNTLVLTPVDKSVVENAWAAVCLYQQDRINSLTDPDDRVSAAMEWNMYKSIGDQALKDCKKIQLDLVFTK